MPSPAIPVLQQLSDGISLIDFWCAIHTKPSTCEVVFTKKTDSLIFWSHEDFLDCLGADYRDLGQT